MDKKSRIAIWVAVIGAIATISVAAIQYGPRWISRAKEQGKGQNQNESVIAGRVVDLDTNLAIPEADVQSTEKLQGILQKITATSGSRLRIVLKVRVFGFALISPDILVGIALWECLRRT